MNFLDEATIKTNAANIAKVRAAASDDDTITVMEKMIGEANAFLAAADAARDKGEKTFEFPKGSGKMHKVTLKRNLDVKEGKLANALGGVAILAGLLLMNKIDSSDPVVQRLKAEYEQAEPAQKDSIQKLLTKRLIFLDSGEFDDSTPMNEDEYNPPEYTIFEPEAGKKGRFRSAVGYKPLKSPTDTAGDLKKFGKKATKVAGKRFDRGFAKFVGAEYDTPFSDLVADLEKVVDKSNNKELQKFAKKLSGIENMSQDEFNSFIRELSKEGYDKKEIKKMKDKYKKAQQDKKSKSNQKPKNVKEAKDIELPADTTFTLDLKHLVNKHMNKGNDKDSAIKFTKALMAKLHNKGEVEIDGTKILFKEADLDIKDMQVALPEPDAPDYLGDDGMDYEGGMAKSQMLKMKKYAVALCDMIEDESQLESWVQAKLTKASDYMSSVFHYLDYQRSKMNENKATIRDIEDEIKNSFRSQGDLDTFMDDLTDGDKKEFLNLMNSDLKGNAYEKALGRLIDKYKG